MKTLKQFEQAANSGYESLQKQCREAVVRWVYANGPLFSFQPILLERGGRKRGRELPTAKGAKFSYGFNAKDQRVYEMEIPGPGMCYENLMVHEEGAVFLARFACHKGFPPRLEYAQQLLLNGEGRPSRFLSALYGETLQQDYTWREGHLVRIDPFRDGGIGGLSRRTRLRCHRGD